MELFSGLLAGCVLLYKQDFTKKLGLCCITCTYCSQTCQRGVTEQLDGSTWDFCSEDCKSKYLLWYCKVRGPRAGLQGGGPVPLREARLSAPPMPAGRAVPCLQAPGEAAGDGPLARADPSLLQPAVSAAFLQPAEPAQPGHPERAREPPEQ